MTRALSVLMCSWPIGLAVAALALPWIAVQTGWRAPFFALSLVCVLAAVFVLVVTPKRQSGPTTTATLHWWPRLSARDWALSLFSGASWAAFTAAGIIYFSFAPPQLVERGYSVTAADARAGGYGLYFTLFYSGLFAFPALAGWLMDMSGTSVAPPYFAAILVAATLPALIAFYRIATAPGYLAQQQTRGNYGK